MGAATLAGAFGFTKLLQSNDHAKIFQKLNDLDYCTKNLINHVDKEDKILTKFASAINHLNDLATVTNTTQFIFDDALVVYMKATELSGVLNENIDRYFEIYHAAQKGQLVGSFFNFDEKLNAIQRVKDTQLPPNCKLLVTKPSQFSLLGANEIAAPKGGFYVVVSYPFYYPEYVFNTFVYHKHPLMIQNRIIMIRPENEVLAITDNKEHYFETSMQSLMTDCIQVLDNFVCPRISKFYSDKSQSCLFNLYQPLPNQTDLNSICPIFAMPHHQYVEEIQRCTFQFYFATVTTVEVVCPGKTSVENLDSNNQIKIAPSCELQLPHEIHRCSQIFSTPSTKNAYEVKAPWFDSIIPFFPHVPDVITDREYQLMSAI